MVASPAVDVVEVLLMVIFAPADSHDETAGSGLVPGIPYGMQPVSCCKGACCLPADGCVSQYGIAAVISDAPLTPALKLANVEDT